MPPPRSGPSAPGAWAWTAPGLRVCLGAATSCCTPSARPACIPERCLSTWLYPCTAGRYNLIPQQRKDFFFKRCARPSELFSGWLAVEVEAPPATNVPQKRRQGFSRFREPAGMVRGGIRTRSRRRSSTRCSSPTQSQPEAKGWRTRPCTREHSCGGPTARGVGPAPPWPCSVPDLVHGQVPEGPRGPLLVLDDRHPARVRARGGRWPCRGHGCWAALCRGAGGGHGRGPRGQRSGLPEADCGRCADYSPLRRRRRPPALPPRAAHLGRKERGRAGSAEETARGSALSPLLGLRGGGSLRRR